MRWKKSWVIYAPACCQQPPRWQWLVSRMIHIITMTSNERHSVSNHQPHGCLLNRLFRCRSKKTSKLRVTGLCVWNSPVTGEFPAQRASNAESVSFDVIMYSKEIGRPAVHCFPWCRRGYLLIHFGWWGWWSWFHKWSDHDVPMDLEWQHLNPTIIRSFL